MKSENKTMSDKFTATSVNNEPIERIPRISELARIVDVWCKERIGKKVKVTLEVVE